MVKRAVTFGICYPGTSSALSGCWNDSDRIKDMLINSFDYIHVNIQVITDRQHNTIKPTREVILSTLKRLVSETKEGDTLFVHYSGHGTYTKDYNGDEKDKRDECWYPCDGTIIKDDELYEILVKPFPKGAFLRLVSDSCHSGSMLDLPFNYTSQHRFVQENNEDQSEKNCITISGCQDSQTSADAYIDGTSIGALTWALTTCIDKVTKSKGEQIKNFTWSELITITRYTLRNKRFSQIPQLGMTNKNLLNAKVDF